MTQILELVCRGDVGGITRQSLLLGLQELLGPFVVRSLGNPLTAAELGNAVLALEPN